MSTLDDAVRSTLYVSEEERPWAPGEGGAAMRLLSVSASTGTWVIQTRLPPGLLVPTHRHTGRVYAFTMKGAWGYVEYDWLADAGSFVEEQAGVSHTLMVPDEVEGAEVLYVVDGANLYFDADGHFLFYEDGNTMLDMYVRACEQAGLGTPTGIAR